MHTQTANFIRSIIMVAQLHPNPNWEGNTFLRPPRQLRLLDGPAQRQNVLQQSQTPIDQVIDTVSPRLHRDVQQSQYD